jgi:hypothetical protein
MDHPAAVRVPHRLGHVLHHPQHLAGRERPRALDALRQRLAVHVRHGEEDELPHPVDGVDRNDVGVRQAGSRPRFGEKALQPVRFDRRGRQQLESHRTVQRDVPGEVDDPHAAPAQLALEDVAAFERVLKRAHGDDGIGSHALHIADGDGWRQGCLLGWM